LPADFTKLSKMPTITNSPAANTVLLATTATSATWTTPSSGGTTNLAFTSTAIDGTVTSDTGTDASITAATSTNAGLMIGTDKAKLDKIPTPPTTAAQVLTSKADGTTEWKASTGGGGGTTYQTYQPSGNANMFARATGPGVTALLTGNTVTITIPDGVTLNYYRIKSTFAAVGNTALNFIIIDQSTSTTDITNTSADNAMLPTITLFDINNISPLVEMVNNLGQSALFANITGVTNRTINFFISGLSTHNSSNGFYINLRF